MSTHAHLYMLVILLNYQASLSNSACESASIFNYWTDRLRKLSYDRLITFKYRKNFQRTGSWKRNPMFLVASVLYMIIITNK